MPLTDGPLPPGRPREPRLPLWFWGGLAAGLATLLVIAGLLAARLAGARPASAPTRLPTIRPGATARLALLPTATGLPLLPMPTPLQPAAAGATQAGPASPAPARTSTVERAPSAAPRAVTAGPSAGSGGSLPTPPPPPTLAPALVSPAQPAAPTATARGVNAGVRRPTFTPMPATLAPPSPTPTASPTQPPTVTATPSQAPTTVPTSVPTAAPTAEPPATPTLPPSTGLAPGMALAEIIPVPANAASADAITATIKIITATAAGPHPAAVGLSSSGLPNVPISVPVRLRTRAVDGAAPGAGISWELTAPAGSRARLAETGEAQAVLVPDLPGFYKVDARWTGAAGLAGPFGSLTLHAGTYAGSDAMRCGACHPQQSQAWTTTGHARIFTDEIDNRRTPHAPAQYAETCAPCHTTGFYPAPYGGAGGFADAMTRAEWQFPTFAEIDAAGSGGPSNWDKMPAQVKNLANVQCEACHGPAKEHLAGDVRPGVLAASQAEGTCNQCHNAGGRYAQGAELQNAAHADRTARAWTVPTGPGEQTCVRCHSGRGYVSFLQNPDNPAAWDNRPQTVVCATCHDPHGSGKPFDLRVAGRPLALPFTLGADVGLSAVCYECHNARTAAAGADQGQNAFPHYNSAAEFLSDTGGVTYGRELPDSPHGARVGRQPVPDPAWREGSAEPKFLFSKAGDAKGDAPGPCVTCHMWPTVQDPNDPNRHAVGGHSFNMRSPDGKLAYGAACQGCHDELKDFNLPAQADYDGSGKVEGAQDEVKGLLNVLWQALEARGARKISEGYPYATLPVDAGGKTDPRISNAWYNFRSVYGVMWSSDTGDGNQGRAQAVHNFRRSVALLQLAYGDLTGQDVPGAEILVK